MARLVFLAVLLAAATYASADATNAEEVKFLNISSCTGDKGKCEECKDVLNYTVGKCTKDGSGNEGYEATCEGSDGWTLKLYTDMGCTPGNLNHTISSAGKCFDGNIITAKVKSIGAKTGTPEKYPVTVNVCPPATEATTCAENMATASPSCPDQSLEVPAGDTGIECEELPTQINSKTYYYSALVKDDKLTLKLYTTKETCKAVLLPVFVGKDMEVKSGTEGCINFQQKLNAEACGVPKKEEDSNTNNNNGNGNNTNNGNDNTNNGGTNNGKGDSSTTEGNNTSNDNDTTTLAGSAAVSAVLALLAAACAVWMM